MCWCYAIIFALKEIYFGNINCKIFKGKSKYQEYVVDVKIWIFSSDLWHSPLNLIEFYSQIVQDDQKMFYRAYFSVVEYFEIAFV